MDATLRCSGCNRRYRGHGDWHSTVRRGRVVGLLCPDCQTPEENAKAEVKAATLVYGVDRFGRLAGRPRTDEDGPEPGRRPGR
jgi:hypothetical protein